MKNTEDGRLKTKMDITPKNPVPVMLNDDYL